MAKARKIVKRKVKKKTWYPIISPKLFNSQVMGEILIADPSATIGRVVPINLMSLTGDMRKQNINMLFTINSATGEKLYTDVIGYEMSPSSIKRMVRRGKNKIDQSFIIETVDNKRLRLKLIMLTRNITKLSVTAALRKTSEEIMKKIAGKTKYLDLVYGVVSHKLQSDLKRQLKKIYPLVVCEVRSMKIEKEKRLFEEKPKEKIVEEKKEEVRPEKEKPEKEEKEKPEEKEEAPVAGTQTSESESDSSPKKEEEVAGKPSNESEKGLETREKQSFSVSQKSSISEKSKTFQKEKPQKEEKAKPEEKEVKEVEKKEKEEKPKEEKKEEAKTKEEKK